MSKRARIQLALACLVAGCILNILIAWGCAIWNKPDWTQYQSTPRSETQRIAARFAPSDWKPIENSDFRQKSSTIIIDVLRSTTVRVVDDQRFANSGELQLDHSEPVDIQLIAMQSGWPMCSLQNGACAVVSWNQILELHWTLKFPFDIPRWNISKGQWLPCLPRFPGFIFNTIFYAAFTWLLIRSPFETRRRLREWRGLCGRCAYPVGTSSLCTECGAPVKRTVAQPHK
jgi:hypothetical protein